MTYLKIALTMLVLAAYICLFFEINLIDKKGRIGGMLSVLMVIMVPLMGAFFLAAIWAM